MTQKITPFLWFDTNAEQAVDYYLKVFRNSRLLHKQYYGEGAQLPAGLLMTATVVLDGQAFTALNGGPLFEFSSATSFVIHCKDQQEVDHYWYHLSQGGEEKSCGWLKDAFGVTWQVIPTVLGTLLNDTDTAKAQRVLQAMLAMIKITIETLEKAHRG